MARCGCVSSCSCVFQSEVIGDCIDVTVSGVGSSTSPYVVTVDLVPDPAGGITCGPAGAFSHTHDGTGGATSLVVGGTKEAGATVPTATSAQSIAIGDFAN